MKQLSMFTDGSDLPLFSGTAQRAQEQVFKPQDAVVQETWAKCRLCKDTGRLGEFAFCSCETGQALRRQRIEETGWTLPTEEKE